METITSFNFNVHEIKISTFFSQLTFVLDVCYQIITNNDDLVAYLLYRTLNCERVQNFT